MTTQNQTLKLLQNLEEKFEGSKKSSGIDLKKVIRIQQAIKKGKYQVDFEKLANALLKHAFEKSNRESS